MGGRMLVEHGDLARDHEISSLQERFSAAISAIKRLDSEPSIEVVDALRRVIDDLDHELRTTAHEPVDRFELTKLSDQAPTCSRTLFVGAAGSGCIHVASP
ncbi:hypothetical protein [Nocardia sp. NPDC051463]|uniref:hypothetical protein n=1 Tax=Nocardia sp. NPDC051463 TaxID=3154845 RepID=UPI0034507BC8